MQPLPNVFARIIVAGAAFALGWVLIDRFKGKKIIAVSAKKPAPEPEPTKADDPA